MTAPPNSSNPVTPAPDLVLRRSDPPPSLNNAYVNRRRGGRCKAPKLRWWEGKAGFELRALGYRAGCDRAPAVNGDYALSIHVPRARTKADVDNLIKPIADLLTLWRATPDDARMQDARIRRGDLLIEVGGMEAPAREAAP